MLARAKARAALSTAPASRFLPESTGALAVGSAPPGPAPHSQPGLCSSRHRRSYRRCWKEQAPSSCPGERKELRGAAQKHPEPQLPCLPDPRESWERQRTSRRGHEEADPKKSECDDGWRKRSGRSEKTGGWPWGQAPGARTPEGQGNLRRLPSLSPQSPDTPAGLTSILHICTPGVVMLREPLTWALSLVMADEPGAVGESEDRRAGSVSGAALPAQPRRAPNCSRGQSAKGQGSGTWGGEGLALHPGP